MAFVGLASASASETALCKSIESSTSCSSPNRYPSGTEVQASSTNLTITTSLGTVTCGESSLKAKTNSLSGEPLGATVSAWTIGTCHIGELTCSITGQPHQPYNGSFYGEEGGNGTLVVNGTGGNAGWTLSCGAVLRCTLSTNGSLRVTGGNPASMAASGSMKTEGGLFCPSSASLSATYTVNSPKPLFLPASTETVLCNTNAYGSLCPGANRYASGTSFTAQLPKGKTATVEDSFTKQTCTSSGFSGKTTGTTSASVSSFELSGCSGGSACTFAATGLPYSASFAQGVEAATLTVKGVVLDMKCGTGTVSCAYKAPTMPFTLNGGSPATLSTALELETEAWGGGICPKNPVFRAEYEISSPSPLFVGHT
jgi:hypothetical protein